MSFQLTPNLIFISYIFSFSHSHSQLCSFASFSHVIVKLGIVIVLGLHLKDICGPLIYSYHFNCGLLVYCWKGHCCETMLNVNSKHFNYSTYLLQFCINYFHHLRVLNNVFPVINDVLVFLSFNYFPITCAH